MTNLKATNSIWGTLLPSTSSMAMAETLEGQEGAEHRFSSEHYKMLAVPARMAVGEAITILHVTPW